MSQRTVEEQDLEILLKLLNDYGPQGCYMKGFNIASQ